MIGRRLFLGGAALQGLGLAGPLRADEPERERTLYAYHLKPPFLIDLARQEGLYFDLAEALNRRQSRWRFRIEYMPRRRLEQNLAAGQLDGAVIGVNPVWFKDRERRQFHWSNALWMDEDVVVSRVEVPLEFQGPLTLLGRRLALPRGYYYFGIDELVREGKILRDDAESEEATLQMVALGRAEATIVTRRTLDWLRARRPGWDRLFHVAMQPHDRYERMLLLPLAQVELLVPIQQALRELERDAAWQARLQQR